MGTIADSLFTVLMSWVRALVNAIWALFSSDHTTMLEFLGRHWAAIALGIIVVGLVVDRLVWLIRWRPHWVWFRKKRVIINDKNFFADEKYIDSPEDLKRRSAPRRRTAPAEKPRRNWEDSDFVVRSEASRRRAAQGQRTGAGARGSHVKSMQLGRRPQPENRDVFQDDLFNVNAKQKFSDKYEDEVFNVSNLPRPAKKPRPEAGSERRIEDGAARGGAQRTNRRR